MVSRSECRLLYHCQDKSSTKAHKLVHNYMRASTALRLECQNKNKKRNKEKRTKVQSDTIRMEGDIEGINCQWLNHCLVGGKAKRHRG